jgi:hypothetical protein
VHEDVLRQWRTGEERLYPVVTVRPDLYETVTRLVRSLADHLASVPDLDALVTSYRTTTRQEDLDQAGIDAADLPPEIDLGLVRDAAYQFRARELSARAPVERTLRLIQRARAGGERTVEIWSEGEREHWPPYRRVEMSLATGMAVSVATELDADSMTPVYVLEAFQLDPETGESAEGEGPIVPRRQFTDHEAWREAAAELRRRLLTP